MEGLAVFDKTWMLTEPCRQAAAGGPFQFCPERRPCPSVQIRKSLQFILVDPDEAHLLEVSTLLNRLGYNTTTFNSAEDFLESGPDPSSRGCVVSEMELPGISGLELLSLLREREIWLPFIALTSDPDIPPGRQRAPQQGRKLPRQAADRPRSRQYDRGSAVAGGSGQRAAALIASGIDQKR